MPLINNPETSPPRFYWDTPEAKARLDLDRVRQEIAGLSDEDIARAVLAISKTSVMNAEAQKERKKEKAAGDRALKKAAKLYAQMLLNQQQGDQNT
jgi:hypothetical protein